MFPGSIHASHAITEDDHNDGELLSLTNVFNEVRILEDHQAIVIESVHRKSSSQPPISLQKLKCIERAFDPPNLWFCHELIFDPNLKIITSTNNNASDRLYWSLIEQELLILSTSEAFYNQDKYPLLLHLIRQIRDMIIYIYPESRAVKEDLMPVFEPEFVLEQMIRDTEFMKAFMELLVLTIKANCAPKRDSMVDRVLGLALNGNYVEMFQTLLNLMELMKIDLINHSLPIKRSQHLQNIVERERKYFNSKFNPTVTKAWVIQNSPIPLSSSNDTKEYILELFLDLLFNDNAQIPETFEFDRRRINKWIAGLRELIIVSICLQLLGQFTNNNRRQQDVYELKARLSKILNDPKTTVLDIGQQLLLVVSRNIGMNETKLRRHLIISSVDKVLDPRNEAFLAFKLRLRSIILDYCCGNPPTDEKIKKSGLSGVLNELSPLMSNIRLLWGLHWNVHCHLYDELVTNQ